jgi:23S rRNA (adenine2503-C2)-methyltransferase
MWMIIKNDILDGEAGLQVSVNTTDQHIRWDTMPKALPLYSIAHIFKNLEVKGRKIALNFALTDAPIDENALVRHFSPERFLCKITPMHMTNACIENSLITKGGYDHYYPYKDTEERLKSVGYDVIVFIPSKEEDDSRITCGNAILADKSGGE